VLVLDHDRLATAKRRTDFFQEEIYDHVVRIEKMCLSSLFLSFFSRNAFTRTNQYISAVSFSWWWSWSWSFCQQVLDGDGTMDGHKAMQTVLESYNARGRKDKPVIFNLTGNVMDADQEKLVEGTSKRPLCFDFSFLFRASHPFLVDFFLLNDLVKLFTTPPLSNFESPTFAA